VGETVAGIALPEGDPGAAADAASGLRSAGGGFERTASTTQSAVAIVGSWQGAASFTFRDRCGGYQDAAAAAHAACERAALALRRYAERLEEARERVRRLQERAEECVERIEAAEARAADATERGDFASRMAFQSSFASAADAGATAASFREQADTAYADAASARAEADRARDELERLRRAAESEREAVKDAGARAAGTVEAAQAGLPTVAYPAREAAAEAAAAARAEEEEEEDKPWYEDVGDAVGGAASWTGEQVVGLGKGVGEGVVGIGEGGLMLYRLSSTNALIDRDSWEREWSNVGDAAQFAWENPGEFGKAVANWEDLSEGRYGEWVGNLGPDAVLAVATAGSGTVATRGLRSADAVADAADAARDADRVADAARSVPDMPRPSWRQSELDVGTQLGPGYREQLSFLGGREVASGTPASVRPDWYTVGDAVEVKNYDVQTTAGRGRLVNVLGEQLQARVANLPEGTAQRVFVDIRGQDLPAAERVALAERIAERSGGAVRPEDVIFKRD
jgi:hypothetical protein